MRNSWNKPTRGRPMNVLWHKLQRLKYTRRSLHRNDNDIRLNFARSGSDLQDAQANLIQNLMDSSNIERIKKLAEEVLKWNLMEEKALLQRTKIDWLKSGDGNNEFFYAYLKTKQKDKTITLLRKSDRSTTTSQNEIAHEMLNFYGNLMGAESRPLIILMLKL